MASRTISLRHRRAIVMVAVVAFVLAACGGTDGEGVASLDDVAADGIAANDIPADGDEVDTEQALIDFAECMRERGVEIEDPTVDADGNVQFGRFGGDRPQPGDADFDPDAVREARDACGELLEGVTLGVRRADDTEFQDRLVEFASCMRDNGVEMDDPDFAGVPGDGGPAGGGGPFGEIDRNDPVFEAAMEACGEILDGFGPARGGDGAGDE